MRIVRTLVIGLVIIAAAVQPLFTNRSVSAVTASDWKAGRIIDDTLFTNANDMSVADIQNFLNSKVSSCDTWGTKPATEYNRSDLTHAQYAASRGWPSPPYVCLRDYYEIPKTSAGNWIPDNNYNHNAQPFDGAISAAQIIYNAAQAYNISAKALLVKLGTESAGPLTTDRWPLPSQYTYAMGAHCPDSGPNGSANCDANYAGFSIQMSEAAALLRWYLDGMTQSWWQYKKPNQVNSILWNVAPSGCGAGDVYIETKATAALYTYTPYQPNQAALNNMYGLGDGCSAYGNRNFWRTWNDWFGTTQYIPPYQWSYIDQAAYRDLTFTNPLPKPYNFTNGQRVFYTIVVRNTGTATWTNSGPNPLKLGTLDPNDRASTLCDSSWLDCARPALLSQNQVAPGQIGTFGFWITAPQNIGSYHERLGLVAEGLTLLNDTGLSFDYKFIPTYKWGPLSVKYYLDSAKTKEVANGDLVAGKKSYVTFVAQNTGNMTWTNTTTNPIRLASLYDKASRYCDATWIDCARVARMTESTVAPGGTGTFSFEITNPKDPSVYGDSFNLVVEGSLWMINANYRMWLATNQAVNAWSVVEKNIYSDGTKQQLADLNSITKGQRLYYSLKVKNTGNTIWLNTLSNPLRLGTYAPRDHKGVFYDSLWIDQARTALLKESIVYPGEVGTFEFWIKAPASAGTFTEAYNIVCDGNYWMRDAGFTQTLLVH